MNLTETVSANLHMEDASTAILLAASCILTVLLIVRGWRLIAGMFELRAKDKQIRAKDKQIRAKDKEIASLKAEISRRDAIRNKYL